MKAVRRRGTVSISGVYGGEIDPMPMMEMFDRGVQLRMGQAHVRRWIDDLMPLVTDGSDPLGVKALATHRLPLQDAPHGYEIFRPRPRAASRSSCGPERRRAIEGHVSCPACFLVPAPEKDRPLRAAPRDRARRARLPRYLPQMTSAAPAGGDKGRVEARVGGRTESGEAWMRIDRERWRIEWGAEGPSDYSGKLAISDAGPDRCTIELDLHTPGTDNPEIDTAVRHAVGDIIKALTQKQMPPSLSTEATRTPERRRDEARRRPGSSPIPTPWRSTHPVPGGRRPLPGRLPPPAGPADQLVAEEEPLAWARRTAAAMPARQSPASSPGLRSRSRR